MGGNRFSKAHPIVSAKGHQDSLASFRLSPASSLRYRARQRKLVLVGCCVRVVPGSREKMSLSMARTAERGFRKQTRTSSKSKSDVTTREPKGSTTTDGRKKIPKAGEEGEETYGMRDVERERDDEKGRGRVRREIWFCISGILPAEIMHRDATRRPAEMTRGCRVAKATPCAFADHRRP